LDNFIKTNYNVHPYVEPGTIELLVGAANIIEYNDKSDELVANKIDNFIEVSDTDELTIYLNLHRYILYLIFEEIQIILAGKDSLWTNAVVLDAINTATRKFREEIL